MTEHDLAVIRAYVARVDARAEADVLKGNPLTGAHYRAMRAELEAAERSVRTEVQP